ncbi:hypothetical protein KP509_14G092800 [Ceratopteris richardii]|uniref:Glutaminyl-peptide cyclotransferase n=1 Tax=Ceratopteris richardii TaxID=49495 RepID=A0A8T2TFE6_CERRI|nr:hypothetical protein KP509_14G092800 [Ceratopteris richardii]
MSRRRRMALKPTMKTDIVTILSRRNLTVLFGLILTALLLIVYSTSFRQAAKHDDGILKDRYRVYTFDVVKEYDHDRHAFTQGLVYAGNDTLYESTGMYGSSSVRKVHLQSGQVLQMHRMERNFFGEGLTLLNDRLFQVAWRIRSGFIYDTQSLSMLGRFNHPMKDGWGLATDGKYIYGSDGTSTIYVMEPSTFKEERRVLVKDQDREIHLLNELEYIDGELWANVWMTDCIVRISPLDGKVLGWVLLHELRNKLLAGNKGMDVLNGIAWDLDSNRLFGKYWPKLYEIKVRPHSEELQDRRRAWEKCPLRG